MFRLSRSFVFLSFFFVDDIYAAVLIFLRRQVLLAVVGQGVNVRHL